MHHNSPPSRPTVLRSLAEQAAQHPSMEQAVAAAVSTAVRATLPGIIEQLLMRQSEEHGGTLRLYMRKVPRDVRAARDQRVLHMLASGAAPEYVASVVGCSRAHVYALRKRAESMKVAHPVSHP